MSDRGLGTFAVPAGTGRCPPPGGLVAKRPGGASRLGSGPAKAADDRHRPPEKACTNVTKNLPNLPPHRAVALRDGHRLPHRGHRLARVAARADRDGPDSAYGAARCTVGVVERGRAAHSGEARHLGLRVGRPRGIALARAGVDGARVAYLRRSRSLSRVMSSPAGDCSLARSFGNRSDDPRHRLTGTWSYILLCLIAHLSCRLQLELKHPAVWTRLLFPFRGRPSGKSTNKAG